jgi:hypothetical protein
MTDTTDTQVEYEDDGDYTITFSVTLPAPADETTED